MRYNVLTIATFGIGSILQLSDAQAARRCHALRALRKGIYEVHQPVQFKRGEVVGYDGELPKAMAEAIEDPIELANVAPKRKPKAAISVPPLAEPIDTPAAVDAAPAPAPVSLLDLEPATGL